MTDPKTKVCSRCRREIPKPGQRWCQECKNNGRRDARRKRREENARIPSGEQSAAGARSETEARSVLSKKTGGEQGGEQQDGSQERPRTPGTPQPLPSVADAWTGWQHTYLEHVVRTGGTIRALARAGITPRELQDAIDQDRAFAEAVDRAKGEHADDLAEELVESRFPVGRIVRLKALRPAEYIERSASINVTADLNPRPPIDATALLKALLGNTTDATRKMLGPDARLEDAPVPETS